MSEKVRAAKIVAALEALYPEAVCSLTYDEPWKLLFSARLAAQCTDKRVNEVAKTLYLKYPTLQAMADADLSELEETIRSTGLFRTKARDLKACAAMLLERFDGQVPDQMDELLTLPGVGRKIANLVLGDIYGKPAVVTDTHCIRLANRMGFCETKDALKVERALAALIEPGKQNDFCHRLVLFGRDVCTARSPHCETCVLAAEGLCPKRL